MGFLERAKQAAAQAAEQAKTAASQVGQAASDPATAEKAKAALGRAKRGMATAIDRIDPAVLADIIIKATALQERANTALKAKGSPYRISQIEIGASIPPSVSFAISRLDDLDGEGALDSTHLAGALGSGDGATIQALDGTRIDEAALLEPGEA